jgi:hypothetical protein
VTLFTPNTREANHHPSVYFEGQLIPLDRLPKFLGLIFSTLFVWTPNANNSKSKSTSRLQLMKAISGLDFGDKETLLLTYNSFMKPCFS